MRFQIIGSGLSAQAAKKLLLAKGETVADENPDFVVISPGYPLTHEVALAARKKNIPIIGEVELGLKYLPNRAIGVTGTNGKTTAVLFIEWALKSVSRKAKAMGNVGLPAPDT